MLTKTLLKKAETTDKIHVLMLERHAAPGSDHPWPDVCFFLTLTSAGSIVGRMAYDTYADALDKYYQLAADAIAYNGMDFKLVHLNQ